MVYDYPPIIMSWCFDGVLSHETCQRIINLGGENWKRTKGDETSYRVTDVSWINDQWIYDLLWKYMKSANEKAGWKYDIVSCENCQLARYTEGMHFTWHRDALGSHNEVYDEPTHKFLHGNTRKLSMSIFLNSDYEGGDFEIHNHYQPMDKDPRITSGEGSIIVFPSFIVHRVVPVTKGIRYSLVAWFLGPPFV